jgi:hypothetical protein
MADPLWRIESLYHAARLRPLKEWAASFAESCSGDDRRRCESNPSLKSTLH